MGGATLATDRGLLDRPLAELARQLRAGGISAHALLAEAIGRHQRHAALDAYKLWDPAAAAAAAAAADAAFAAGGDLGPLQGLPVSVKDVYGVTGWPIFAGCQRPLPERFAVDGGIIAALRRQQAVLVGKTHTVQFAFGGLGTNVHWPMPRNPWDARETRVCGGSSAGAGVSLVEGSCVLALASDTGGSTRTPAAFTGTVGFKPTRGRWPTSGMLPLSPTLDAPGILTRSVADAAFAAVALDAELADEEPIDAPLAPAPLAGLRIGIPESLFWEECAAGVAEAVRDALAVLERRGARLVPFALPEADAAVALWQRGGLSAPEFYEFLTRELADYARDLDPSVVGKLDNAAQLTPAEVVARRVEVAALAQRAALRIAEIDAVATPTVPIAPPRLADLAEPTERHRLNLLSQRNAAPANFLGLCALSLPAGKDRAGLPVGLQLCAAGGADARLLQIALAVEGAIGTARDLLGVPPL